jgi:chromosome segregation ATPase
MKIDRNVIVGEDADIHDAKAEIERLQQECARLASERACLEIDVGRLRAAMEAEIELHDLATAGFALAHQALGTDNARLRGEIEQLRTECAQLKQANADLLHDMTVICEMKNNADNEIKRLCADIKQLQAECQTRIKWEARYAAALQQLKLCKIDEKAKLTIADALGEKYFPLPVVT